MDNVKQLIEPIDLGMISQTIRVGKRSANQTLEIMRPSRGVTDGALLRGILKVPPEKPGVVEKIASNRVSILNVINTLGLFLNIAIFLRKTKVSADSRRAPAICMPSVSFL